MIKNKTDGLTKKEHRKEQVRNSSDLQLQLSWSLIQQIANDWLNWKNLSVLADTFCVREEARREGRREGV